MVEERVGVAGAFEIEQDVESQARVKRRVEDLLVQPLTADRAVQIALLNNRGLQATLERLGVAQADLVEAGLLENPVIAGDLVASTKGYGFGGGASVSQSLLSVFLIPAKRRLAKAELRGAVLEVTNEAVTLARDTRVAYVAARAAESARQLHRELVELAEVADELAERQFDAGNLHELDRGLFSAALDHARLELAETDVEAVRTRETLTRLLGLWGEQVRWVFAEELEEPVIDALSLERLEPFALEQRLDVSAARNDVAAAELALQLRRRGLIPHVEGGAQARKEVGDDIGHEWVIGPSLSIEVPIFNPGHADFARLRAHLRATQFRLEEAAVAVRSDVRTSRAELVKAQREIEYYRRHVLPRQESIASLTLEQYNAMQIGTYQLLEVRADLTEARKAYVEALRAYWVAHADLELAVGGRLPP